MALLSDFIGDQASAQWTGTAEHSPSRRVQRHSNSALLWAPPTDVLGAARPAAFRGQSLEHCRISFCDAASSSAAEGGLRDATNGERAADDARALHLGSCALGARVFAVHHAWQMRSRAFIVAHDGLLFSRVGWVQTISNLLAGVVVFALPRPPAAESRHAPLEFRLPRCVSSLR